MEAERVYKDLLWQDSGRMGGEICFYGTRIPVTFLFSSLEDGGSLEEFCVENEIEPRVARAVLELAASNMAKVFEDAA